MYYYFTLSYSSMHIHVGAQHTEAEAQNEAQWMTEVYNYKTVLRRERFEDFFFKSKKILLFKSSLLTSVPPINFLVKESN